MNRLNKTIPAEQLVAKYSRKNYVKQFIKKKKKLEENVS